MTDADRLERLARDRYDRPLPKRFYTRASAGEAETGGWQVLLDGRPVRTPLKQPLVLPARALAEASAQEWQAQETVINPAAMPLTRMANTAIDRVATDEARIIGEIAGYAASDLVCYRAQGPEELIARQDAQWGAVLAWAARTHGARFICVAGVMHEDQPPASLAAIRAGLTGEGPWRLTAIHNMTTLTGSALIAMMVASGALAPDQGWAAAHLDEDWQIEYWGEDAEAQARRGWRKADFDGAVRFLELAAGSGEPEAW